MSPLVDGFRTALGLGLDAADVGLLQMALRTVLVYGVTLAVVRLGAKRFLSRATAFDAVVAIMVGSIMSRAVNGSAPLGPTLLSGAALLGMHWLLASLAFHSDRFGVLAKGEPRLLIEDGEVDDEAVRAGNITRRDLEEAIRLQAGLRDHSRVDRAYLERSGKISVLPRSTSPQVVSVSVAEGVQTVRIRFE